MSKIIEAAGVGVPTFERAVPTVLFKKLEENAIIPNRAHETDAGFDLYALHENYVNPNSIKLIRTGIAVALPMGTVGLVSPRSGLALKNRITITNAPGIIDSGYRSELMVILHNTDPHSGFTVTAGDRIAQLVVTTFIGTSAVVDELPEADRGNSGFGSTGS